MHQELQNTDISLKKNYLKEKNLTAVYPKAALISLVFMYKQKYKTVGLDCANGQQNSISD